MSTTAALEAFWMPFTANRQFKSAPRLLERAQGMFYWDDQGCEILDATAGLWCVNAGHCRPEIHSAITEQSQKMDFAPTFQMGHPLPFQFADRLIRHTPAGLDHVFFTNSGSESADTALKIALAYHYVRGETERNLFIGREKAYHGVGFGGISVGGLPNNRRAFAGNLIPADHLPHTLDQEHNRFHAGLPPYDTSRADALETLISKHGAQRIAAVIVEPVAGSAGVIVPPEGYLQRLRKICDEHGILLIFDEVITGFGRLGTPFASQFFDVVPDILTTAKALTNAAVPMGAVFASTAIHDAFMLAPENQIEFFHGYTYSGHPLACAAGLATLDIYEGEGLLTRGAEMAAPFAEMVHSLRDSPNVRDIRNLGLMAAIELEPRSDAIGARGYAAMVEAFYRGLLIRATGDTIALSPPLIIELKHLDRIYQTLRDVLRSIS
ncbi:aspartate aminotransferase family protein [Acidithiobacillus sp. AMEEHan]|uniref:aspartate aminotransferase family protein n=1 Tax=Acidithiobacillus sp. AMEEHan TaxID=2994951 RepID=UPI0027E5882D|nr:aspartate aminotransferase family protein [Acidithiobacillus sp. AMEEHan]